MDSLNSSDKRPGCVPTFLNMHVNAAGGNVVNPQDNTNHTTSPLVQKLFALPPVTREHTDEVPEAARALIMFSNDACMQSGERSRKHSLDGINPHKPQKNVWGFGSTTRTYKFVPKREDDRILIAAFRDTVTAARTSGLTNEHIAVQIGEAGMSANLISKIVHGHRGLGRFREPVTKWTEAFSGSRVNKSLFMNSSPGSMNARSRITPGSDSESGSSGSNSISRSRHGYKFEIQNQLDRSVLTRFRDMVQGARRRGWTNERIAIEIGAYNANVVSKLVHGHQGLGRYRERVTEWSHRMETILQSPVALVTPLCGMVAPITPNAHNV